MTGSEWREELRAATAAVERESAGLAAAKEVVRSVQKSLDRARQRKDEVLLAFLSGESQLPLFADSAEDDASAAKPSGGEPGPRPHPSSAAILELVREACYHDDRVDWGGFRRGGASDSEILAKLRETWPASPTVKIAMDPDFPAGDNEYAILGGDSPAFWPFDPLPPGASLPSRPYLTGENLCLAIRKALHLEALLPDRTTTADPVPDESPDDEDLRHALHSTEGAAGRWAESIAGGESDESLKRRIASEFGDWGSFTTDLSSCTYQGGRNPRIWFGARSGKPSLQGKALVARVRDLLAVPLPEGGGA